MGKRSGSDEEQKEEEAEEGSWRVNTWGFLSRVRELFPLIQCITNFVSMDLMANTFLAAAGASPAMVHALEEVPDFTPHASGLLVNIGTLTPSWLASMKAATEIANRLGKPWVLDPVFVSASAPASSCWASGRRLFAGTRRRSSLSPMLLLDPTSVHVFHPH